MKNRVVVTGLGVVSPIGIGKDEFWSSLKNGKSGIDLITNFDPEGLTTKIAAEVKDFDVTNYIDKKQAKRMDRFTHFAIAASKLAMEDSQLEIDDTNATNCGVILGSGIGGIGTLEKQHKRLLSKGPGRVSPFLIPMMISNIASGYVSMELGAKGPNETIVTACASGTHAIGTAFKTIQRGDASVMITGGAEASITQLGMAGFCKMKAMSTRNDNPKKASRPFDKHRDGFVMGEGSGILILESLDHALERGARIYAEIVGFGMTGDAHHITAPAPGGEGAARSMEMAINDAGINPQSIDYINAHGTSTPLNDKFETMAIKSLFKEHAYDLVINSTKSMCGHLLGASGAVESIASILSIKEKYIHQTLNFEQADEELDLNYAHESGIAKDINYALSNSLGFGGHNGTLVFKKFK